MMSEPHLVAMVMCALCGRGFLTDCGESVCQRCESHAPRCVKCDDFADPDYGEDEYCKPCALERFCDYCGELFGEPLRVAVSGGRVCDTCIAEEEVEVDG